MKLRFIDSLRGIAILGVILVHTSQYGTSIYTAGEHLYPGFINRIFEQGARGVQLFYVVSAFTLFLSFYERTQSYANFNGIRFFIRRIFRVIPIFWLAILYYGFIKSFLFDNNQIVTNPVYVISNLTLLNSLHPGSNIVPGGWSISVEMLFYIMLPFLYKFITNTNKAVLFTLITISISIFYNFFFFTFFPKTSTLEFFHFTSIPNQLPIFGFGIIAFFLVYKKDYTINPYLLFTISVMLVLQLTLVRFIPNHILFGISFMLLIIAGDNIPFLKNSIIAYLGKISYSAYFIHFAVLSVLNRNNFIDFYATTTQPNALINMAIRYLLVLAIVIPISTISYYLIELPTQKLGKQLIKKIS